ncbi:phosphopantetheine-binding protein [Candidatus Magnetaquicoccus inordinatus]|uniref:phosphopantetheine-binding protein n=1 Tax=Candidatus Magnetaquicoccus inordinatus TaxID=2496818 RepID=UPI00102C8CD0|nr:phosphopantetheine-binding protein [Candidatus Magnetaquicoccus inordinatus]
MNELLNEIKELIVISLKLEDVSPADIGDEMLLFDSSGCGFDSIDALELGVALRKKYGITINAETSEIRNHFATVKNLATFILSIKSDSP